jgi:hypothetical protein
MLKVVQMLWERTGKECVLIVVEAECFVTGVPRKVDVAREASC